MTGSDEVTLVLRWIVDRIALRPGLSFEGFITGHLITCRTVAGELELLCEASKMDVVAIEQDLGAAMAADLVEKVDSDGSPTQENVVEVLSLLAYPFQEMQGCIKLIEDLDAATLQGGGIGPIEIHVLRPQHDVESTALEQ